MGHVVEVLFRVSVVMGQLARRLLGGLRLICSAVRRSCSGAGFQPSRRRGSQRAYKLGCFYLGALGLDGQQCEGLLVGNGLQLGLLYFVDERGQLCIVDSSVRVFGLTMRLAPGWKCSGRQFTPVSIFWCKSSHVTSSTMRQRPSLSGRESTWQKVYLCGQVHIESSVSNEKAPW